MPVYEYRCEDCGKRVEVFVRSFDEAIIRQLFCPSCKGGSLKRIMSSFAYHRSEADRLASIDTSRPQDESYYRDDRNIGLWAKKRMKELGYNPGSEFEGIVEKARKKVSEELG